MAQTAAGPGTTPSTPATGPFTLGNIILVVLLLPVFGLGFVILFLLITSPRRYGRCPICGKAIAGKPGMVTQHKRCDHWIQIESDRFVAIQPPGI